MLPSTGEEERQAGDAAQWAKEFPVQVLGPEFHAQTKSGRRKLTLQSCPLTSTGAPWHTLACTHCTHSLHTHTHTIMTINKSCFKKQTLLGPDKVIPFITSSPVHLLLNRIISCLR